MATSSGGWLQKLSNLILPPPDHTDSSQPATVSNTQILHELAASFDASISRESVGSSMLFNAHFLILLHPDTYEARQNAFPVIVDEAVQAFNARIDAHRAGYQRISPVASGWFFKFGAGREFAGDPIEPDEVRVVGALTGLLPGGPAAEALPDNLNVTRRVKQTNRFEKIDVDQQAFRHIDFREPGAFGVRFSFSQPSAPAPSGGPVPVAAQPLPRSLDTGLATIRYYIAELNRESSYRMVDREIVVARKEPDNQHFPNYLLVESAYVSNPHARIRFDEASQSFQVASFSRNETRVDEQLIPRSEPASPQWFPLPDQAQLLLNSMVTLHFNRNY
ncbi:hypothetical protein GCM10027578_09840 [Spirosoma luteolum]